MKKIGDKKEEIKEVHEKNIEKFNVVPRCAYSTKMVVQNFYLSLRFRVTMILFIQP